MCPTIPIWRMSRSPQPRLRWSGVHAGEARQMLQGVLDLGKGGTFQSSTERDIVVRTSLARLEQLDIGDQALYFGRIDRLPEPDADGEDASPAWGSRSTSAVWPSRGPDHEPLVVDWRAPVAEPFYRATGLDPQGLARRRHLAVRGVPCSVSKDEYFVDPDGPRAPLLPVPRPPRPGIRGERLLSEGSSSGARARCSRRSGRPGPATWATSSGPSSGAGRDHPLAARRRAGGPGRPGNGQDGRRAAPRRVPALHPPLPPGTPGRAGRRAQPAVPALHRAGAPFARGDGGEPVDGGRPRARGAGPGR